ncbi:MAG TPA: Sapep family Mn(2+)-dependent dipeptidase [Thermoanaerobaculia bacterium]|nr:Sapep family Mn(2+)-dependent dipeptidase [Thermoanaerobaculia bacterium]
MNALLSLLAATAIATNVQTVLDRHDKVESKQLAPLTSAAVKFPTYQYNDEAHVEQKAWLLKTAADLGFVARDAGKIVEIELPGPAGAPVLGLVVHGDVQPVEADAWSFPPFEGRVDDNYVYGRGSADDKGPLAQALVAMKALEESGIARTHTIRLLVGSEEESSAKEMPEYLAAHAAPDYSLVLDSEFPVVVGEKAWNALSVVTTLAERPGVTKPYRVVYLDAGLGASIVPERAEIRLHWKPGTPADWKPIMESLRAFRMPEGTRIGMADEADLLRVVAYGKSAHAGVNLTGGRNALVALARLMEGRLPSGGANDLLAFVRQAGQDLHGTGLGIKDNDPIWGRYSVNIATIKLVENEEDKRRMTINIRSIPPRTGAQLKRDMLAVVAAFNKRTGANLVEGPDGYWDDTTFGVDPNANLVKRLVAAYEAATGTKAKPAISGGGTYAKRIPNAIAFGMWFPGKPYPGHDVDEKMPVADLDRGARVLIRALVDIATGPKVEKPFARE